MSKKEMDAALDREFERRIKEEHEKEKFERIVEFSPAFDKRTVGYGIGAVTIKFILKGSKGAVQVYFSTQWYPEHIQPTALTPNPKESKHLSCWDVGYHSPKKMYKGQRIMSKKCPYVDGGKCYYDGSSLRGQDHRLAQSLIMEGSDAIWKYLEGYYNDQFGE